MVVLCSVTQSTCTFATYAGTQIVDKLYFMVQLVLNEWFNTDETLQSWSVWLWTCMKEDKPGNINKYFKAVNSKCETVVSLYELNLYFSFWKSSHKLTCAYL